MKRNHYSITSNAKFEPARWSCFSESNLIGPYRKLSFSVVSTWSILRLKRQHILSSILAFLMLIAISFPILTFPSPVRAATLYDSGDPTPAQQLVLEYINRARANPIAEGQRLRIDIHEGLVNPSYVGPRPPLAMNKILLGIAQRHSQDMYSLNYFSHNDPNGTTPFGRMIHTGYNYLLAGENMAAAGAEQSATELEDFMMVDSGTSGRPHRMNLLDLITPYPCSGSLCVYYEVGIGYYGGTVPNGNGLTSLITEDFGARSTGPFLLGVMYNDRNSNNFYDIGEGIGGVRINTSTGSYYAVSSSSGGYAIPIAMSGTITVTASGTGFGPITKTVTLNGTNIKLDFTPQSSSQTSLQSTTQTSLQSITQSSSYSATQTLIQSTTQSPSGSVTFQSIPSNFPVATTPGTIAACGSTFTNGQSAPNCGNGFTATANSPTPSTGWQFNHWTWSGGVTCSSNTLNPTSCSASNSDGSLIAVYSAQVTFITNPASSALMSWGSCSNPGQGNGASIFSTSYGTASITACYIPYGYAFSNWSCSGGLACSSSNNPVTVTLTGPGTITLNLQGQTSANSTSTISSASTSSVTVLTSFTSNTLTIDSSSSTTLGITTYSTTEFDIDQTVTFGVLFIVVLLIAIRRKTSKY